MSKKRRGAADGKTPPVSAGKKAGGRPQPAAPTLGLRRTGPVCILAALFFLLVCLTVPGTAKWTGLLMTLIVIAAVPFHIPVLSQRATWPALMVTLWVIMSGVSTLYAVAGKFALSEFLKLLTAFCVFVLILAFGRGYEETLGRRTALLLESCTALFSFFSIDFLSTRIFSGLFFGLVGLFTTDYRGMTAVEPGVRMTSVLANPNVFAGCVGLGVLLSLGLAATERDPRVKRVHLTCLAVNSLGFLLAFSMGASGAIALAFLVYLLLERKERRASLLLLMVETLVVSVAAAFPVYLTAFDQWDGLQPVPLLCTLAVCVALCALDAGVGQKLAGRLAGNEKAVFGLLLAVLAAVAVYAALAFNVAGPASLSAGESLRRSAYLDAGDYVLTVEGDGQLTAVVESQNRRETMMHTNTVLYSGPAQGASFTVPEGSMVVYVNLFSPEGARVQRVSYRGAESGSLKLSYRLIPGFVANRLQGLFANQNAIQRVVFFQDGLKLFRRAPLFGLGMGAFENSLFSVQSFYYETKYAHNHYIQTLVETGAVGLLLFAGTLLLAAAAVLRARRRERSSPLTAALGAALVFMACHGGVEVVFSSCFYLPLALGVLGLVCLCCGDTLPLPAGKKAARRGVCALPLLLAAYAVLLAGNMYAGALYAGRSRGSWETAIALDRFEWADYALNYVYNSSTPEETDPSVVAHREAYFKRLEKLNSNTVPLYLAECYFNLDRVEDAFRMLDKYTTVRASDQEAWRSAFTLAMNNLQDAPEYRAGVRALYEKFQTWNSGHMGGLTLDQTTLTFLEMMAEL